MRNLDNVPDFNAVLNLALLTGITHVAAGQKRVRMSELFKILASRYGQFGYRRFHEEILNRAYGLAFVNAKKMEYVRSRAHEISALGNGQAGSGK